MNEKTEVDLVLPIPQGMDKDIATVHLLYCVIQTMGLDDEEIKRVLGFLMGKLGYTNWSFRSDLK